MLLAKVVAALPEATTGVRFNVTRDLGNQLGIAHRPVQRRCIPSGTRQPDACTGPAQRPRVDLDKEPHRLAFTRRP
ncbi:conserved hypothetical protein [Xanthomonas citri pv. citri]|nr:conserved hypothetical protein [Xanthomonas citri pv. citri]CEE87865.1 conserved hypothetical protein [Xanthomonas citri pv. citri]CEH43113.1 conserved hypothetical protein [Xanthomonas citri pv. citri]CEJ23853.1 conserved hypothetical protein [Xanthomonas citri pv. citri]CEJ29727.1 conserved hypothetical protein [Xanthomonas citri pv. citri]